MRLLKFADINDKSCEFRSKGLWENVPMKHYEYWLKLHREEGNIIGDEKQWVFLYQMKLELQQVKIPDFLIK